MLYNKEDIFNILKEKEIYLSKSAEIDLKCKKGSNGKTLSKKYVDEDLYKTFEKVFKSGIKNIIIDGIIDFHSCLKIGLPTTLNDFMYIMSGYNLPGSIINKISKNTKDNNKTYIYLPKYIFICFNNINYDILNKGKPDYIFYNDKFYNYCLFNIRRRTKKNI